MEDRVYLATLSALADNTGVAHEGRLTIFNIGILNLFQNFRPDPRMARFVFLYVLRL